MRGVDTSLAAASCVACGTGLSAARCSHCGAAAVVRDYQVARVLSEQPHSRVYLATAANGASVVLKELAFSLVPNTQVLEAFHREAELLRQLSHPRLPSFIDAFQEGTGVETRLYLAMSYVEGRSLLEELEQHRFNETEVLDIAAQGLELLVYLHGLSPPVIHRDVKPANLLRRPDGSVALVDFGAAREVQRATAGHSTLVGTVGYMPPEQLVGVTTPGSDVYALGATLLHLLSRKPPAELMGEDLRLEFRKEVNLRKPALAFLERLVHRNSRKRFATAAQALKALESVRSGSASRRRVLVAVGRGLAISGVLAAGLYVYRPQVERLVLGMMGEAPPVTAAPVAPGGPPPGFVAGPGSGTQLQISCPAGTVLAEDLKKNSRWCSQTSATGHQVRQGPFVRWDNEGNLVERSSYVDDKLHGAQVQFREGKQVLEGEWRAGKKVGLWVSYGPFGGDRKEREETYKDDVLEGPWRSFDYSGGVEDEGTYQNGKKQGVWSHYSSREKQSETTFDQGLRSGPYTSWHHYDTSVNEKGAYTAGEKTGPWVTFHANGQKRSEGTYERDKEQGEWSTWHANGQQASLGSYVNGQKVGPWTTWHDNGQKEKEGAYEKGSEIGTWTTWFESGVKGSETVRLPDGLKRITKWFSNGKMESQSQQRGYSAEGTVTTWHENGKKKSVTVYKDGRKEALATTWHENGRKASEGRYLHDFQVGVWRWWEANGKVQRVENFQQRR